jgi:hypothetical protein
MKVYLAYEVNEADLRYEVESVSDIDCFDTINKAIDYIIKRISQGLTDGFVPDNENEEVYKVITERDERNLINYAKLFNAIEEEFKVGRYFSLVMFRSYQENWQCYYTIVLEEKNLQ